MAGHIIASFLEHQNPAKQELQGPARIIPRDSITPVPPAVYELDNLQWGQKLNGPAGSKDAPAASVPPTPGELESSQPPTPKRDQAVSALLMSFDNPKINRWRLVGAGIVFLLMGMSDAATGALIPYLEKDYNVGYAIVSLVFVTNAAGFIMAAPFTQIIDRKLGRARSYVLVNTLLIAAYTALVCAPPFPVVIVAFFFLGLGLSIFLAMTNIFVVNLMNGTVLLGVMHGIYGLGGTLSPILATSIVSRGGRWSQFYAITLGLAVVALFLMGWSYRGFEQDSSQSLLTALERTASRQNSVLRESSHFDLFKRTFKQRSTFLGALFILFYQGAEVAISGWVISFLISYRDGNPSQVGYTTSGFWGGITVGRLVLTHFAAKIGEKNAVPGLVVIAAAFQLLVWLVPNIIGNAVAEAIVGLALGPVYPCATAVLSKLLPRNLQITALSFVTSMGSSGGALIPLITGLLAQRFGTVVLHPIVLISSAFMLASWLMLPRIRKPIE